MIKSTKGYGLELLFSLILNLVVICNSRFLDPIAVTKNWNYTGFELFDQQTADKIIGMVHFAARHESREVYMKLDYSYLDDIFDVSQKVNVIHIPRNNLGGYVFEPLATTLDSTIHL